MQEAGESLARRELLSCVHVLERVRTCLAVWTGPRHAGVRTRVSCLQPDLIASAASALKLRGALGKRCMPNACVWVEEAHQPLRKDKVAVQVDMEVVEEVSLSCPVVRVLAGVERTREHFQSKSDFVRRVRPSVVGRLNRAEPDDRLGGHSHREAVVQSPVDVQQTLRLEAGGLLRGATNAKGMSSSAGHMVPNIDDDPRRLEKWEEVARNFGEAAAVPEVFRELFRRAHKSSSPRRFPSWPPLQGGGEARESRAR